MTATREQVEETILAAWNWTNWFAAGVDPTPHSILMDVSFIRGYALGYLGRDDYDRLRARLTRWPRIDQPATPMPPCVTRLDLEELVR